MGGTQHKKRNTPLTHETLNKSEMQKEEKKNHNPGSQHSKGPPPKTLPPPAALSDYEERDKQLVNKIY